MGGTGPGRRPPAALRDPSRPDGAQRLTSADITFQLSLDPGEADRLARLKPIIQHRTGRWRNSAVTIVWHDTAGNTLRDDNRILSEYRKGAGSRGKESPSIWRLESRYPDRETWLPGAEMPVLAEAASPDQLGLDLSETLVAIAAFAGQSRSIELQLVEFPGEPVVLALLSGDLRTLAATRPACRMSLSGPAHAVGAILGLLAELPGLAVPTHSLAADGLALSGLAASLPPTGAPTLPPEGSVDDAFTRLLGQLAGTLLYWAPRVVGGHDPQAEGEPVHQMRVAVRRLRSALSLFAPLVGGPEIATIKTGLKRLGGNLGPARDWDVFLAGTARALSRVLPDDTALVGLIRAGEARRTAHYQSLSTYLLEPEFRRLSLLLAWASQTRPWRDQEAARPEPLHSFAAGALRHRRRRLLAAGDDISELPDAALHAIRLRAKQLRYACEFFAPMFPGKSSRSFTRHLADLQEELGRLNDSAVATRLLGEVDADGRQRARAQGIVVGYLAAVKPIERRRIGPIWQKLRRKNAFPK